MTKQRDESALCHMLDLQSDRFGEAIKSLDAIEAVLRRDGWTDAVQESLHHLNQELVSDASYGHAIQQWNDLEQEASAPLQHAVERARSTLQSLLNRIDGVETMARGLKDRLLPRVDQAARMRTAVNAYRRASQSGAPSNHELS